MIWTGCQAGESLQGHSLLLITFTTHYLLFTFTTHYLLFTLFAITFSFNQMSFFSKTHFINLEKMKQVTGPISLLHEIIARNPLPFFQNFSKF